MYVMANDIHVAGTIGSGTRGLNNNMFNKKQIEYERD
jgi:hypothetical protein